MNHPQQIARVFGVLYLITFATSIPALFVFYAPVLEDPRYILGAGADTRVQFGAFLEIVTAIAGIGTAVVLFPSTKIAPTTLRGPPMTPSRAMRRGTSPDRYSSAPGSRPPRLSSSSRSRR